MEIIILPLTNWRLVQEYHGRLVFYPSQPHMGPNWLLKWSILAFSEKLKSVKRIFKNLWVKNQISAAYNSKIDPRGWFCIHDLFSRPFQKMCNAYWQIMSYPLFPLLKNHPPIIERSVWQRIKSKNSKATFF